MRDRMRLAHIYRVALFTCIVVAGCDKEAEEPEKEKEETLECGDGEVARNYCCYDPTDLNDEGTCDLMCFPSCASDDDCSGSYQTCQDGACGEMPGDCSL